MDMADALAIRDHQPRPSAEVLVGTVVAVPSSGMTVTVDLGGETELTADGDLILPTVQRLRSYSPVVDDVVMVVRSGGSLYCVGALNPTPPPPDPDPEPAPKPDRPKPPPPPPKPVTRTRSFGPIYTGSFRSGSWRGDTSDLYQGDWSGRGENFGGAFYGNGPASLRGAAVRARVHMLRVRGAGVAAPRSPRMRLLAQRGPGPAPTEIAAAWGPALGFGQATVWTLPSGWAQALMNGQAGGIGVGSGGEYLALAGKAGWAPAMVLEMTWRQ